MSGPHKKGSIRGSNHRVEGGTCLCLSLLAVLMPMRATTVEFVAVHCMSNITALHVSATVAGDSCSVGPHGVRHCGPQEQHSLKFVRLG